jgi:hypothetical protein
MQRSSKPDPFMDAIQEQLDYVTACEYAAGSLRTHEAERLFATAIADLESMMVEYDRTWRNSLH